MVGTPESGSSKIQQITQLVREHPLYTAGLVLMGGAILHAFTIAIPANQEASDRLSRVNFSGGPEVAMQVDLRRAEILGGIYNTKYQREINGGVTAVGVGGALLLAEVGLNLARRGRRRLMAQL